MMFEERWGQVAIAVRSVLARGGAYGLSAPAGACSRAITLAARTSREEQLTFRVLKCCGDRRELVCLFGPAFAAKEN